MICVTLQSVLEFSQQTTVPKENSRNFSPVPFDQSWMAASTL